MASQITPENESFFDLPLETVMFREWFVYPTRWRYYQIQKEIKELKEFQEMKDVNNNDNRRVPGRYHKTHRKCS